MYTTRLQLHPCKLTYQPTDRPSDRQTDRPTDKHINFYLSFTTIQPSSNSSLGDFSTPLVMSCTSTLLPHPPPPPPATLVLIYGLPQLISSIKKFRGWRCQSRGPETQTIQRQTIARGAKNSRGEKERSEGEKREKNI